MSFILHFVYMSMGVGLFTDTQVTYQYYTTKENDSSYPTTIIIHDGVLTYTILCMCHSVNHNCNELMSSVVILCSSVSTLLQPLVLTFFSLFFFKYHCVLREIYYLGWATNNHIFPEFWPIWYLHFNHRLLQIEVSLTNAEISIKLSINRHLESN